MLIDIGNGVIVDAEHQLRELDRVDYEDSLYAFLKAAWKYIDPARPVWGWAIDAVCEHLQAVVDGEIRRLIINIPPRMSKSSTLSVAFPAWVWAQPDDSPTSGPGVPMLYASYAQKLSLRDSVKCRRLIESKWYQSMWGDRFQLLGDQNVKSRYGNDKGGERLITSIGSGVTGEGGQIIVIDDPNAANEVDSEATIETTNEWWDGTMPTRHNDPKTGATIVCQQRLAEDDLTGHTLNSEDGEDWTHLVLPMEYEPERSFVTVIGWKDPRTEPGELLCPERFGPEEVASLKRRLGPFKAAGQLQQRPDPPGGGIIKREWWQPYDEAEYPPFDYILASLDTAYTEKQENDCSAITIWGVYTTDPLATTSRVIGLDGRPVYGDRVYTEQAPKLMLMYGWQGRLELHDLVTLVAHICGAKPPPLGDPEAKIHFHELTKRRPRFPIDKLIIEAKASGHSVAQEIKRIYGGENFGVQLLDPGSQDKVARLYSVQHLFSEGMIYAPEKVWSEEVINQVAMFPKSKLKDLTDTVSQALRHLRDMGLLIRAPERLQEIEDSKVFHGRAPAPLYPA